CLAILGRCTFTATGRPSCKAALWTCPREAVALAGCIISGFSGPYVLMAAVFGFLVLPLAGTFKCPLGWPRNVMAFYTGAMALVGFGAIILLFMAKLHIGPSTKSAAA